MIALKPLRSFIKQHALFLPEERILLAVSGGRDSVLMVHLFKDAGFNFGIAHCNFKLRGDEADKEELFTAELASELEVPFFATAFETSEYAANNHISIQMAARDLRYLWLEEIRKDFDFQYIALAHHQNDVIETMMLNLIRGTGISGLHGILPKKGKLIRPLLFLTRDEIDEIMRQQTLAYCDDSSNQSTKYARNRIRSEIIPVLKELNPGLEHTFEANRKRFAELEILMNQRVAELKEQLFKKLDKDGYEISLTSLKKLIPLNTLLYGLFNPFGFRENVLNDLVRAWDGSPGKMFCSATHQLLLDRNRVILSRTDLQQPENVTIKENSNQIIWNGQKFKSRVILVGAFQLNKESNIAQLDFEQLNFPLKLRTWKSGDSFHPLGLKTRKKLSDFFTEQKIPLNRKKDIGILENKNGDIIWVAGFRIDERYKITGNTKKVFILEQSI